MVEEVQVECCIVDNQFGIADEVEELIRDVGKARLMGEKFAGNAVNPLRLFVNSAIRLQVDMEVLAGQPPVYQFDAADFDDPVPLGGIKAGGFGVEDDLAFGHEFPVLSDGEG
ncbi:hypothetical protein BN874_210028 [Candidatus Contendobacter odensis Run_B_J11]|uniref:Uncharacterized protein n=1 Tax=Candidatus Contendobacter odensis Run_B_J11 TaxID=1400861 RepID=A0A7U7GBD3_9GAMM|nr:hypothetical protein BN874_210028 [Candidatus Contendobacter odensis Run_B_J11]